MVTSVSKNWDTEGEVCLRCNPMDHRTHRLAEISETAETTEKLGSARGTIPQYGAPLSFFHTIFHTDIAKKRVSAIIIILYRTFHKETDGKRAVLNKRAGIV